MLILCKDQPKPPVWYALQTFYQKESEVESYLRENGYSPFIPRFYQEKVAENGKSVIKLTPAVHNLLFLPKEGDGGRLARILTECPVAVRILRHRDTGALYEIPDSQMVEFRLICDPQYKDKDTFYTDRSFAEERPGKPVRIKRGLFKGIEGKLVRYQGRYYMVVCLATMGVFLKIARWNCEPIDVSSKTDE